MGYRLNCGIELTDCEPGDSFIYKGHPDKLLYCGGRTYFDIKGQRKYMICQDSKEWPISRLTPTEETKRKVLERQGKCKCGYVIPVMKITSGPDVSTVENMLASVFNLGDRKPQDAPEIIPPLARIVDWKGGEEVKPMDIAVVIGAGAEYKSIIREILDCNRVKTYHGALNLNQNGLTVIRINTAAIPKQRTMTKAEVEREFGVKVVD